MSEQQQEMIDKMRSAINEKDKTIEVSINNVIFGFLLLKLQRNLTILPNKVTKNFCKNSFAG